MANIILIVESDFTRALLIENAFSHNGVSVRTVRSCEGAKRYINRLTPYEDGLTHPSPALALLDLDLCNSDGLELLRWIRTESDMRDIPIIAYGDFEREWTMQMAYDAGANACFPRQYGIIKIISAVKDLEWVNKIVAGIQHG